jgi:dihydroorotase
MTSLLVRGGRLVDPAAGLDSLRDLRMRAGAVVEIGPDLQAAPGEEVFDARGATVAPGFIDIHVHLRQPGFPEKETIATGTQAAVRGGFTAVACMPNTNPALDDAGVIRDLMASVEREAYCRVYPIAALTRGRKGAEPCDYTTLASAGAVAFSDEGDTVEDRALMREAARLARALAQPFIAHCMPEVEIVARDLEIAGKVRKRWHIAHVSTAAALDLIHAARASGVPVTCEATPHHLTFTNTLFDANGAAAKVHPPLRSERDVEALRRGVREGSIDLLACDHAPHTQREKEGDIHLAAPGFSGLEIAVGAYAAALPDLPLTRFVELLSTNPARILGLPGGGLAVGNPADITIFADRPWIVDPAAFASKGKCTPFAGRELPRKVIATIVGGEVVYRATKSPA